MTANRSTIRLPFASAATLVAVILLVGLGAFVAGVAVGAPDRELGLGSSPGVSGSPTGTPPPTPVIETLSCTEPSEAFALLCETYAQIKSDYVDEVSDQVLVEGAVRGMVESLPDPYSGYLPPEQYRSALDDLSGQFSGIGAEVGIRNLADPGNDAACTTISESCALVIVAPLAGSPAEAAGLRAGDVVLAVDGESTAGSTVSEQVFKVRGEPGTTVTLSIRRENRELEVTVTRAVIELREVESRQLASGVGYLRLTTFTDRAPRLFREALAALLETGTRQIILDLRDNPGGFIVAAQEVASQFVPEGELLFTVESGSDVQRWESQPGGLAQDVSIELVVLINAGSASASEIVAAALAETGRARLIGEPTFGKDTVQVWTELDNGGGLRLTTDRWFTPNHNSVAGGGIQPDIAVAGGDAPGAAEDPVLQRALQVLGAT